MVYTSAVTVLKSKPRF